MNSDPTWHERVPKVELHLHLEGAIPYSALWELVQKYGGDPALPDVQALKERFVFRDFPHFIETWVWKNSFLREYEDFTFFSEAVARDLGAQNIRYAEVFYSPADFARFSLTPQGLTQAVRRGLERVPGIEIALVADLVRDFGPERGAAVLEQLAEVRGLGVIGIGIGGSEQAFPPEPFAAVYARARSLGFHTSAHAGEAAGPESIRGAVEVLGAERIGHGTRIEEDPTLLAQLIEMQVPVEMCPLSNVRTGVVPSIEAHPIRRCFEAGLLVTVNSDDPKMFGNSLAEECCLLEERLGFSRDEVRTVILNGIRASWLPEERKKRLAEAFRSDPAWNEPRPSS